MKEFQIIVVSLLLQLTHSVYCCMEDYPCFVVYNEEQATQRGGQWGCWGSGFCSSENPQVSDWLGTAFDCRQECGADHCCAYDNDMNCLKCDEVSGYFMFEDSCVNTLPNLSFSQVSDNMLLVTSPYYDDLKSAYQQGEHDTLIKGHAQSIGMEYDADIIFVFPKEEISPSQNQQFFSLSGPGNLKGAITSNGYTSGRTATMHEIGHHWLVHLPTSILPNFYKCGAHWGYTMLDMKGMLGGFAPEGVRCSDGRTPTPSSPCAAEGVQTTLLFDSQYGSPQTSNDFSNPTYSKIELGIMGLYTPEEMTSYNLYYCDMGESAMGCYDPSFVSYSEGTYSVTCASTKWINGKELLESEEFDGTSKISQGTELKVIFAQIFDENPPETLTEVNDDGNFAVSKWIQGYADIWPDMWSSAVENRATATLNITRIGGSEEEEDSESGVGTLQMVYISWLSLLYFIHC